MLREWPFAVLGDDVHDSRFAQFGLANQLVEHLLGGCLVFGEWDAAITGTV